MIRTQGRFVSVSVRVHFNQIVEVPSNVVITNGDTLKNLLIAKGNYGSTEDLEIPECTVIGFTMKPADVKRGATRIYDGVPVRMFDVNGGQYRGFVQEVVDVRDMIIAVPSEDGDDKLLRVNMDNVFTFELAENTDEG